MTKQFASVIFGGTRIGNRDSFQPANGLETFLAVLTSFNVTAIDTAQSYGNSESTIGRVQAGQTFDIDTKWSPSSWGPDATAWAAKDQIIASAEASVRRLCVEQVQAATIGSIALFVLTRRQVNIFYLHRPDPLTPIAETLAGVNAVFKRGLFRRFGLSGFTSADVEAVYSHCAEQGYVLPTVYQGSYNPLSRQKETNLFPTLKRLGISFYAYGTSAGGFLCKSVAQVEDIRTKGTPVSATCRPYMDDDRYVKALGELNSISQTESLSMAELVYRWVAYHSALGPGDALVINASSPGQLEETLRGISKGRLAERTVALVNDVLENVNIAV